MAETQSTDQADDSRAAYTCAPHPSPQILPSPQAPRQGKERGGGQCTAPGVAEGPDAPLHLCSGGLWQPISMCQTNHKLSVA